MASHPNLGENFSSANPPVPMETAQFQRTFALRVGEFNSPFHYRELTDKLDRHIREQGSCLMDSNRGRVARNNASVTVQNILDFDGLEDGGCCCRLSQSLSL